MRELLMGERCCAIHLSNLLSYFSNGDLGGIASRVKEKTFEKIRPGLLQIVIIHVDTNITSYLFVHSY